MIFSEVANKHHARCLGSSQRGFSEDLAVLLTKCLDTFGRYRTCTNVHALEGLCKATAFVAVAKIAEIKSSHFAFCNHRLY
jgi:hypothetical protein